MARRDILLVGATFLLGATTFLDPYTWFLNASDMVFAAPYWQSILGVLSGTLLLGAGVLAWRNRADVAATLLTAEFSLTVLLNLVYIGRDGLDRFARGFAGEEYLSLYLVLLMFRVWILRGMNAKACRDRLRSSRE